VHLYAVQYHTTDEGQFKFTFKHVFTSSEPVFFAFTFPFGYHDNERMLNAIDARFAGADAESSKLREEVYYRREVLARSLEGRPVHVLTVTSPEGMLEGTPEERPPGMPLEPPKSRPAQAPPGRKVFVVSAGVHPGEKPANHMVNGVVEFLLRTNDARARALRELYVFKIIPMLNPDGAYRGGAPHVDSP
jgi:murein tripeptide amidase MpaA